MHFYGSPSKTFVNRSMQMESVKLCFIWTLVLNDWINAGHLVETLSYRTKSIGGRLLDSSSNFSLAAGVILLPSPGFVSEPSTKWSIKSSMSFPSFFGNTVFYLVITSVLSVVWVLIIVRWRVWDDLGGGVLGFFGINICVLALRKEVLVLAWLSIRKCVCSEITSD